MLVTSTSTAIESAENAMSGARPVMAIVIGTRAGVGVLHTKSLRPLTTTCDEIAATIGPSDLIRTANALDEILGESDSSVTTPAGVLFELKPTGTKTPSADMSSRVKFASTSDGVKIRSVCVPDSF